MKKRNEFLSFFLTFLAAFFFVIPALFSYEEDQQKIFRVEGRDYKVAAHVSYRDNSSDIILSYGGVEKNLSRDFTGENMYPEVEVHEGHFFISWVNYKERDESFCFYDSSRDDSRVLVAGGLKHITPQRKIIFQDSLPAALIFKANPSDNYDLFCYGFKSGEVKNITNTPAHETKFQIISEDKEKGVIIESKTLYHQYRFRLDPETLEVERLGIKEIIKPDPGASRELTAKEINTYITYGDSITWGKVRMDYMPYDPTNIYYHPELAYPYKIRETLEADYGEGAVDYYNLSDPGDSTEAGVTRLYELNYYNAKFFLLMLGTNDAYTRYFDLGYSLSNLAYIVDTALGYNMEVIISTIFFWNDRFWNNYPQKTWTIPNIQALNAGIINMANSKGIRYIETYKTFMDYNPPEGWRELLESRGKDPVLDAGGQHPSPLGHDVITGLLITKILSVQPAIPKNISASNLHTRIYAQWAVNYEFDFSHYNIMFGYSPGLLNRTVVSESAGFTFLRPPFPGSLQPNIYFRVQAEDDSGNKSEFISTYASTFDKNSPGLEEQTRNVYKKREK
ncbi:SGNH/GDSL hydrolase family protein [Acidobacteriota bacterium]